jgi:hypothetical protein
MLPAQPAGVILELDRSAGGLAEIAHETVVQQDLQRRME